MFQWHAVRAGQRSLAAAVGLTAALVLMVGAAPALADTTIGQTGQPVGSYTQGDEMVDPAALIPPGGDTVTSFQSQSSVGGSGTINFQVLRPEGSGNYLVVGETGAVMDPGDGNLDVYSANIPVQAGDVLGLYIVSDWSDGALSSGSLDYEYQSEPSVGQVVSISGSFFEGLNESATLHGSSAPALAAQLVSDSTGVGRRELLHKSWEIQRALDRGHDADACRRIGEDLRHIGGEAARGQLTSPQATQLTTDADNLAATLGC